MVFTAKGTADSSPIPGDRRTPSPSRSPHPLDEDDEDDDQPVGDDVVEGYDDIVAGGSAGTTAEDGTTASGGRRSLPSHCKEIGCPDVVENLRASIWALLEEPNSSVWAYGIAIFIMVLIGVGCTAFVLETLPDLKDERSKEVFNVIEIVSIVCFTTEYVGRVLTTPRIKPFCLGFLNIIDLLAIAPWYIEQAVGARSGEEESGGSGVFRIIRLVRVLRIFKLSRYLSWLKVFAKAAGTSARPLSIVLMVIAIGSVVFSSLIYYAERGEVVPGRTCRVRPDGKCTPYESIPHSMWWAVITMTTVGYGDVVPVTLVGKLIAVITALSGILVLAIPITVISTNFQTQYELLKKRRERIRERMMLLQSQFKAKRTGLDAMLDEVEELVQRNTMELRKDMEELFEQSALELKEELVSLVKLAYRHRRKRMVQAERSEAIQQLQGSFRLSRGDSAGSVPDTPKSSASSSGSSAVAAAAEAARDVRRTPGHDGALASRTDSPPAAAPKSEL